VTGADDADAVLAALQKEGIEAQVMGYVAGGTEIQF
jgi:hypothetical protein